MEGWIPRHENETARGGITVSRQSLYLLFKKCQQTKSIADRKRAPRRRQLSKEHFQLEFSIKIMNSGRMSEFKNVRICKWKCCKTLTDLRAFLSAEMSAIEVSGEKPDFEVADLGYIEPGHGMKGRKQWLSTDSDVQMMYEQHAEKCSILL